MSSKKEGCKAKGLTIGKVAKRAGVNIETVRYYELRGLLPEPPRTESGYRLYHPENVTRLRFIKQTQKLGFSLQEIAELLALQVNPDTSPERARQQAGRKAAEIEAKIRSLQAMQAALEEMIAACERGGPTGNCPLLETIEHRARDRY